MDEILSHPPYERPELRSLPRPKWRLPRLALPSLPNMLERRSPLDPVIFLTAALSIGSVVLLGSLYTSGYAVTVDGVSMGQVATREEVEAAVDRVEKRASGILGYDYVLEQDVEFDFNLVRKDELVSVRGIETYLFDQIGEVMKTSVLTVNGQRIGAADDADALDLLLEELKAPYITENTLSVSFVEPVVVTKEYLSTSELTGVDSMREVLTSNSLEQVSYLVQAGDTFSGIANDHNMRMADLEALNPGFDVNRIMVGDVLTISQAVPFLSVKTVDHEIYEGPVPYEVEEVLDDTIYEGNRTITTPGVEGSAIYDANVTYINGVEDHRDVNSMDVLTEPVTQVVHVGTKPRPKTMATGSFQWPIWGTITSGYGQRYIFGSYSYHSGIDIAAPYGSSIAAADGGKVIWAGTGTGGYWSYGNYVVIDHENGLQTIYAHCSSLCVSAGQRVYKGQTIAKVGSTGRSTGNHCHFQVKVNGTTVSPYGYLP